MQSGSSLTLSGVCYDAEACFVQALRRDSHFTYAWTNLGCLAEGSGKCVAMEGFLMSSEDLFLRAIRCDRQNSRAFFNLALAAERRGPTEYNGRKVTAKDLYMEALWLDSTLARAFYALGNLLSDDEKIYVDGKPLKKNSLQLAALRLLL